MAFNLRTLSAKKSGETYVVQYQAYDDADDAVMPVSFQVQGLNKKDLTDGLRAKVIRIKETFDRRSTWVGLSDQAIDDLKTEGVI